MEIEIKHIFSGKPQIINDGKREPYLSSYRKTLMTQSSFFIEKEGLKGDTQSDKENHGGEDKAICVYSLEDYNFFEKRHNLLLPPSAFGENFTIVGVNDSDIYLGDQFACGEVIFEVSQPRQPCWKISSIMGIKNLTSMLVKEHRSGFYLRVLQEGEMKSTDRLKLIARDYPKFTIAFVNQIAFNAKENQAAIKEVIGCPRLSEAYRVSLERRYSQKEQGLQEWQRD